MEMDRFLGLCVLRWKGFVDVTGVGASMRLHPSFWVPLRWCWQWEVSVVKTVTSVGSGASRR